MNYLDVEFELDAPEAPTVNQRDRAIKALEFVGSLNCAQLASALRCSSSVAWSVAEELLNLQQVQARFEGKTKFYYLPNWDPPKHPQKKKRDPVISAELKKHRAERVQAKQAELRSREKLFLQLLEKDALSCSKLARALGLNKNTAQRTLFGLVRKGKLIRLPSGEGWVYLSEPLLRAAGLVRLE